MSSKEKITSTWINLAKSDVKTDLRLEEYMKTSGRTKSGTIRLALTEFLDREAVDAQG
jgi:hypothetical protein